MSHEPNQHFTLWNGNSSLQHNNNNISNPSTSLTPFIYLVWKYLHRNNNNLNIPSAFRTFCIDTGSGLDFARWCVCCCWLWPLDPLELLVLFSIYIRPRRKKIKWIKQLANSTLCFIALISNFWHQNMRDREHPALALSLIIKHQQLPVPAVFPSNFISNSLRWISSYEYICRVILHHQWLQPLKMMDHSPTLWQNTTGNIITV